MSIRLAAIAHRIRSEGVARTALYVRHRISEAWYERRLSIRTAGNVKLPMHTEEQTLYQPTDYRSLHAAFSYLDLPVDRSVFLDYGCGMGRVLVYAGTFPFQKIIGVELSDQLSEIARDNVQRARAKLRCHNIEIVTASATDYVVPPEVNVIYLFNPFKGEILRKVIARIKDSFEAAPRRLTVAIKQSIHFDEHVGVGGWLTKVREVPCSFGQPIVFYETR